jgi:hypothetical protein
MKFNVEVSEKGVGRIHAQVNSIAEANQAAKLSAAISFPLSLVDEQAKQTADPKATSRVIPQQIWTPRDEELGVFEQMQLGVAEPVEPIDVNNLPTWLIDVLKRAQPRHPFWENTEDLPGGINEAAWMILQEYCGGRGFLDHEGFIEDEHRGHVLVSEPYGLTHDQLGTLLEFVSDAGLKVHMNGISNHAPSRTMRIEIWKA